MEDNGKAQYYGANLFRFIFLGILTNMNAIVMEL